MAHQPTIGRDSGRSSTTELLPTEPKTRIHADFTLDPYNLSGSMANFDLGERATATMTVYGNPNLSGTIQLVSTSGYTTLFTIDTNVSDLTLISDPDSVRLGVSDVLGDNSNIAERIAIAINTIYAYAGVSGITAESDAAVITLTQRLPGAAGNTSIAETVSAFSVAGYAFSGGVTFAQAPFSKRFQLVRSLEDDGNSLRRNDQKTEG